MSSNEANRNTGRQSNIKIIIATHKKYRMPQGEIYLPLYVGAEGKNSIGYQGDNTGDNISLKNPCFCELTGLYWAWKNLDCDYLGLAHYRRHFSLKKKGDIWKSVLNDVEAHNLCGKYDITLPARRKYFIETLYSHYEHTHYKEHLDITRNIFVEKYPEYLNVYDSTIKQTYGFMFNMFLMRKDLAAEYCEFLFDVMDELEKRVDTKNLTAFHARFYGRVGEILFNVWLNKKMADDKDLKVKEIGCIHMEKINWWEKGTAFLKAKFFAKRYEGSF